MRQALDMYAEVRRHCRHRPGYGSKAGHRLCLGQKARQARELMGQMTRLRATRPLGKPPARVISFDAMWTYVGARRGEKRQEAWIWTAVVEEADGKRWGCFQVGDRSEETFSRLLGQLPEAGKYRSDEYVVYGLLPRNRHVPGKGGEVNRNEGNHSQLRDRLRRLQRKTKGYSKSVGLLRDSIALVYLKLGLI